MDPNLPIPTVCPTCHVAIRPNDYFCFNCGTNLHPRPPSTSALTVIILFTKALLLPPFGILWAWKYFHHPAPATKIIGITTIALTIISLFVTIQLTQSFINFLNEQVNSQLNLMNSF